VTLVVGDDAKQDLDDDEYIWLAHGDSESAYVRDELWPLWFNLYP
jgi:hypothetical protein